MIPPKGSIPHRESKPKSKPTSFKLKISLGPPPRQHQSPPLQTDQWRIHSSPQKSRKGISSPLILNPAAIFVDDDDEATRFVFGQKLIDFLDMLSFKTEGMNNIGLGKYLGSLIEEIKNAMKKNPELRDILTEFAHSKNIDIKNLFEP